MAGQSYSKRNNKDYNATRNKMDDSNIKNHGF